MPDTTFLLIRHGETDDNLAGILQGHRDTPLNATGLEQARAIASRLVRESPPPDAIYSSDLSRASATAEIIGTALNRNVIPVPELREWRLGELEGRPCEELWTTHFPVLEAFRHEAGEKIAVPGGEDSRAFERRVFSFFGQLAARHSGQHLAVITHGGVLRCVFRLAVGPTAADNLLPLLSNGGCGRIVRRASGEWQLCTWNDTSHLAGIRLRESITF